PETHHLVHLCAYVWIGPVEVRLKVIEAMEVPGLCLLVEGPGFGLLTRKDGALMPVRRLPGAPDIPIPVRRVRATPSRHKPGMLVGGVVDDQIEDDPDAALLRSSREFGKVTQTAQFRIDSVVIGDVVPAVTAGT